MAKKQAQLKSDTDEALDLDLQSQELQELIAELDDEVTEAKEAASTFHDELANLYEHRRGLVGRPFPHLPFKGAADIRFPIIDKYCDRLKSVAFNTVVDAPHAARFLPIDNPQGYPAAQNLELYFDFVVSRWQEWKRTLDWLLDRWVEQGKCVAKITWECSYEPQTTIIPRDEAEASINQLNQAKMVGDAKMGNDPKPLDDEQLMEMLALAFGWDLDNPIYKERAKGAIEQYRKGDKDISLITDKRVYEGARVSAIYTLEDLIVPAKTCLLSDAEWVAHDVYYTPRQLRQEAIERGGKYQNVEDVIEMCAGEEDESGNKLKQAEKESTGIQDEGDEEQVCVRELYCWLPVKHIRRMKGKTFGGDETPVRCVLTYCPDALDAPPLRVMELPYQHNRWPFEECNFEGGDRFYDCRGVAGLIKAFQEEYNISRNAAINRRTLILSPPIIAHRSAKIDTKTFRQVGQVYQTDIPPSQAVEMVQFPDIASGFEFEATGMEQFAAEYLGLPDLRMRGYQDSPTATQVQQVQEPANAVLRRRLELFHDFLGRVFQQVFHLERQYRFKADQEGMQYPNVGNPEETRMITPTEFQGEFIIQSGGDLQRMDNMLANQMMFLAYQDAQQPYSAPYVNPYDVKHYFYTKTLGPLAARTWLKPREQAAQAEQQFMQQQAQAMAQMQAKGGRNPNNKRFKQIPTGQTGIVPQ